MDATSPLYGHSGLIAHAEMLADAELLVIGILQFFHQTHEDGCFRRIWCVATSDLA